MKMAAIALLLCLGVAPAFARSPIAAPKSADELPRVDIGQLGNASYRIDIPPHWNRVLIVYYHGYALEPIAFQSNEAISPMFTPMLDDGYAVLQSGYSAGGWAVEQGYADTEALRQYFVAQHGAPKKAYVMGMSMGGALTVLTIESKPDVYAGALSLCGAIEPSDRLMQRDLALRAAFDFYFPGTLGTLDPVNDEMAPDSERRIAAALARKPEAAQALLRWYGAATAQNLPGVIGFVAHEIGELERRAHGLPVGNADTIYVGSGDDTALNAGVKRYRASPAAAQYLARWYTPSGKLTRPLLALHDAGDPLVPANSANEYALAATRAGHGENFVQQYVPREGHCVFTPAEIGKAFDALVRWSEGGPRPQAGAMR